MTVTIVLISWAHHKPEHCKFLFNFEFDQNTVSGMGSRALVTMMVLSLIQFATYYNNVGPIGQWLIANLIFACTRGQKDSHFVQASEY